MRALFMFNRQAEAKKLLPAVEAQQKYSDREIEAGFVRLSGMMLSLATTTKYVAGTMAIAGGLLCGKNALEGKPLPASVAGGFGAFSLVLAVRRAQQQAFYTELQNDVTSGQIVSVRKKLRSIVSGENSPKA